MSVALIPPDTAAAEREPGRLRAFAHGRRPSLVVGAAAAVFLLTIAIRLPWGDDLMLHLDVLRRLTADPVHPGDPVLKTGGSSVYYSPYMLTLALIGKAFGLGATALYRGAAMADVVLLLTGLHRFVRTLSNAACAPPFALLGLALWWGTSAIAWSGFLSLLSLADTEAYPSTLATALTLHLWAWLHRRDGEVLTSARGMAGLGAFFGLILLVHQFTGMNAALGCIAILVAHHRRLRTRRAARALGISVLSTAVVVGAWPYYHVWSIGQGELDILDPVHHQLYAHVVTWFGIGLALGIVALAIRWWRAKTDVLVLLFLISGAVVAYGKVSGHWSYGRTWPTVLLAAQLAIAVAAAEALAQTRPTPKWLRWTWGTAAAVISAIGLLTQAGAVVYVLPSAWQSSAKNVLSHTPLPTRGYVDNRPRAAWLDHYLRPGDVVAADARIAEYEVAAHGAYGVTSPWYLPEITPAEWSARSAAAAEIIDPGTQESERQALLREYDVTWLLLAGGEQTPSGLDARFTDQGDGFRLYHVIG